MRAFFGDIRARIHRGAARDPMALAEVLWRAHCQDAVRYQSEVLPYLTGFELPTFTCTSHWQLERLDLLLPSHVRVKVVLDDEPGAASRVDSFCQSEHLYRLGELEVHLGAYLDSACIASLLAHPELAGLERIWLEGAEIDSEVLGALGVAGRAGQLQMLGISNSSYRHALMPGLRALVDSGVIGGLRHLDYEPYSLVEGEERVVDVLARADMKRLEHLRLRGYNDRVDEHTARALMGSESLTGHLRSLDLSGCELLPEALAEVVESPGAARLVALDLGDNDLGQEGARLLARSPYLGRLEVLNLWRNQLMNTGFELVMRSGLMHGLRVLNARGNWVDEHGASAVYEVPGKAPLHTLWLGHNVLGDEGASVLWRAPLCQRLTRLGVQSNGIEARGFAGIEGVQGQLEELYLDFNEPGESGIGALARSGATRRLHSLGLMWCVIEDEGLDALARSSFLRRLRALDISHNGLSTAALVRFVERGGLERPERLAVAGNRLGDEVFLAMHRHGWLDHLDELDMSQNKLREGSAALLEGMDDATILPEITCASNPQELRISRAIEARRGFLARRQVREEM